MSLAYFPKPKLLQQIHPKGHVVIEASAGTGKTYTIEHLVVDLLLRQENPCKLEQILVVTFTERATKELRLRIRHILERVRSTERIPDNEPDPVQSQNHWLIDDSALERVEQALATFDAAPIYTIHGFCQRVLTEHAFATQRPLQQKFADTRPLFERAFMRALRQHLACDPQCRGYLLRWQSSSNLEELRDLLLGCHVQFGEIWPRVDLKSLDAFCRQLILAADAAGGLHAIFSHYQRANIYAADLGKLREAVFPALARAQRAYQAAERNTNPDDTQPLALMLEMLEDMGEEFTLLYQPRERKLGRNEITFNTGFPPEVQGFIESTKAFNEVRVPFKAVVVQLFLPVVQRYLADIKRQEGLFDFNDMLLLVRQALMGAGGDTLRDTLRAKYRVALIDEFQDTDPVQWDIFRRVFVQSSDEQQTSDEDWYQWPEWATPQASQHRLFVIGDPKQAIYAFRGADVQIYLKAKDFLIMKEGGQLLHLTENFRSTEAMIRACNLIFDQKANVPLFQGPILYNYPVVCGRSGWVFRTSKRAAAAAALIEIPTDTHAEHDTNTPHDGPSATHLWLVEPPEGQLLSVPVLRETVGKRIAAEIAHILRDQPWVLGVKGDSHPANRIRPIAAHDIFVLTRTNAEALEIGDYLKQQGVPYTFFAVSYLFGSAEAKDVLDVLAAVAHPHDRAARMRAWLTPFFGLSLSQLEACADLADSHPLVARLLEWHAEARLGRYDALFSGIIAGSGVIRRELFLRDTDREVMSYLHIFEILQDEVSQSRLTIDELLIRLLDFIEGRRQPLGYKDGEGVVQKFGGGMDAVQVMTVHKSKGLEASIVFWAGGFAGTDVRIPYVFHDASGTRYVATVREGDAYKRASTEAWHEDQRLVYVALTRARARLYLPCVTPKTLKKRAASSNQRDGTFAMLNQRLMKLIEQGLTPDFTLERLRVGQDERDAAANAAIEISQPEDAQRETWQPAPILLNPPPRPAKVDAIRARRLMLTSYTRMKAASLNAAHHKELDDTSGADDLEMTSLIPKGELPAGITTGLFLHDLLEHIPFSTALQYPTLDTWRNTPEVQRAGDGALLRYPLDPQWRAEAERVVFTTFTKPLRFGNSQLPKGFAQLERVIKEMGFMYPIPETQHPSLIQWAGARTQKPRPLHIDRGFIKGFIDLVFEHEGRVYLADWKSDALFQYAPDDLSAHVQTHYEWQAKLYTLALVKWLRAFDRSSFEARFGGVIYVFLRGLSANQPTHAAQGLHFERPSWHHVLSFEQDLRSGKIPVC